MIDGRQPFNFFKGGKNENEREDKDNIKKSLTEVEPIKCFLIV